MNTSCNKPPSPSQIARMERLLRAFVEVGELNFSGPNGACGVIACNICQGRQLLDEIDDQQTPPGEKETQ